MSGSTASKLAVAGRFVVAIAVFFFVAYLLSKWLDVSLDFVFDVGIIAVTADIVGQALVWWMRPRGKARDSAGHEVSERDPQPDGRS